VKRVGFLVNPIAGMGGRVGLKGTDGVVEKALALGAQPIANTRAVEMLGALLRLLARASAAPAIRWLTCSGAMGEDALVEAGFERADLELVHAPSNEPASADTRAAVERFLAAEMDIIVFCGGDGTARDICEVVGLDVPILGVPSGVKMYSGVFGTSPARTAEILVAFLEGRLVTTEVDILDLDEAQYRQDEWNVRLYHAALTPYEPTYTQSAKALIETRDDAEVREEIAESLHEQFERDPGTLVLLGPGSTVKSIADRWGVEKTLLGVDAVVDGRLVGRDLNERKILDLLSRHERHRLVLSPIGAQGFVLGRGNLQLSPAVIRAIGAENLLLVATPAKLARTPVLRFDTGDAELDRGLAGSGHVFVTIGYRRRRVVKTVI
jgi:predicted polyphosphate/ATP-dependent NAD kinase